MSRLSRPRRAPRSVLALARAVIAVCLYVGVLTLLAGVLAFLIQRGMRGGGTQLFLAALVLAEAAALAAVLVLWRTLDRRPLVELGFVTRDWLRQWLCGALLAGVLMGAVVLGWYTLVDRATWQVNPDLGGVGVVLVAGLLGFVVQGASEEVLFRGYIQETLRPQFGVRWAIALSAVAFSMLHAFNSSFGLLPFVNLVLFGLAASLYKVVVDGGQLWGVCALHSVWNWLQQVVFGLPNSGLTVPAELTLFQVVPNESLPSWVSGGGFGPEGTLGATLVLGGLVIVLGGVPRAMGIVRSAVL